MMMHDTPAPTTILVTGGCGYLGSQLIRDLVQSALPGNPVVRILDNLQSGNHASLMDLPEKGRYQFIEGDILDSSVLRYALQAVDVVIHLAAIVRTPMSFEHPTWVKQVNQWGTQRLAETCLEMGIQHLIYTSSAAVYGPGGIFHEKDLCQPIGPYASSKLEAENGLLTARERGLKPHVLRLGTLFGMAPITRFDAVVNRFAYLAGSGRVLTIFGKGDQKRPILHVRDASEAILYCLRNLEQTQNRVFNVAAQNASVLEIANAVQTFDPNVAARYTEQDVLTHLSFEVDSSKFLKLGWKPKRQLSQGVQELMDRFSGVQSIPAD